MEALWVFFFFFFPKKAAAAPAHAMRQQQSKQRPRMSQIHQRSELLEPLELDASVVVVGAGVGARVWALLGASVMGTTVGIGVVVAFGSSVGSPVVGSTVGASVDNGSVVRTCWQQVSKSSCAHGLAAHCGSPGFGLQPLGHTNIVHAAGVWLVVVGGSQQVFKSSFVHGLPAQEGFPGLASQPVGQPKTLHSIGGPGAGVGAMPPSWQQSAKSA